VAGWGLASRNCARALRLVLVLRVVGISLRLAQVGELVEVGRVGSVAPTDRAQGGAEARAPP
jgi:hypothetical protein